LAQQLHTGHSGEIEVREDQVEPFLSQEAQGTLAARRGLHLVTFVVQNVAIDFALAFFVVDHQNGTVKHTTASLTGCR